MASRRSGDLILGINSVYHESSGCLLDGANVLAFSEEERFSRVKRAKRPAIDNADVLPLGVIGYCLSAAGASWSDIGHIAYSCDPDLRPAHRPFSPSVLQEEAADWFTVSGDSLSHGFMCFTYPVRPERLGLIPAAVHVDGQARAQLVSGDLNPRYHRLIREFAGVTGVPVVLNTSFNGPDEPIVCAPAEAVAMFRRSGLDALVLGDYLVTERLAGA